MKIYLFLLLSLPSCTQVYSSNNYYCFTDGKKSILLVSSKYPDIKSVKYFPYLIDIRISNPLEVKEVDMGDNAKPEVYRTMNEIIDRKITGQYRFMSQGYLLYDVTYLNKRTGKETSFNKENLILKGINCL